MPRYRVRLVPADTIRPPLELAVRMTPKGVAPAPVEGEVCAPTWEGWGVTVDSNPYVGATVDEPGNVVNYPQDAATFTATVTLIGALCPGQCIEWLVAAIPTGTDIPNFDALVITQECESVTIAWDGSEFDPVGLGSYTIGVYAYVDGKPFGFPQWLQGGTLECVRGDTFAGWIGIQDNPIPGNDGTAAPLNTFPATSGSPFTLEFFPSDGQAAAIEITCGELITADISLSGGDSGAYGDFAVEDFGSGVGFRITCTGTNDYTGINIHVSPRYQTIGTAYFFNPTFDLSAV